MARVGSAGNARLELDRRHQLSGALGLPGHDQADQAPRLEEVFVHAVKEGVRLVSAVDLGYGVCHELDRVGDDEAEGVGGEIAQHGGEINGLDPRGWLYGEIEFVQEVKEDGLAEIDLLEERCVRADKASGTSLGAALCDDDGEGEVVGRYGAACVWMPGYEIRCQLWQLIDGDVISVFFDDLALSVVEVPCRFIVLAELGGLGVMGGLVFVWARLGGAGAFLLSFFCLFCLLLFFIAMIALRG